MSAEANVAALHSDNDVAAAQASIFGNTCLLDGKDADEKGSGENVELSG